MTQPFKSFPKVQKVRSRALLDLCRTLRCMGCGREDGTVVAAHSNFHAHGGKGMATKADDRFVAALCHRCHTEVDQGRSLDYEQRYQYWLMAHTRTVDYLVKNGLWPSSVPLPN